MKRNPNSRKGYFIPTWAACAATCMCGASVSLAQEAAPGSDNTPKLDETVKTETSYRNWFDVSVGGNFIKGNKAQFQERQQVPKGVYGGVTDFHYEQDIGKKGLFEVDGRGLFDNHDYSLRLNLQHPDYGYLRGGYREFRTWYNGNGGYLPVNDAMFHLYDEQMAIDRGEWWFEGGLTLPDKPVLTFRYNHQFREGNKDSTLWADTGIGLGGSTRAIVPTFLDFDERRDIFEFDVEHTISDTHFGAGLRYENDNFDNSRNIHRRPGEAPDRYITQKESIETDLFNVHAFQETWFNDNVLFTTGYSFTTMDTDIGGSRIYGADYDPLYDPLFARRQFHDEGFFNLAGGSRLDQHVANLNFMVTPWENLTIVPSLRIENQDQNGITDYTETDFGAGPAFTASQADIVNTRERGFTDITEGLEARFTGITNWVFYARGEWLQGDGTLQEREMEAQTGLVFRDTDSSRFTQKYAVGANWYPLRNLNFASQYYHKVRKNDYDHLVDSTVNTSADRYPAYIRDQDFTTDDVNFRVTYRPLANLSLVSRYDFQISTIDSRMGLLDSVESGKMTSHIFGESVTWTPITRLFLQGSVNYVIDRGETPAIDILPALVQRSDNDYVDASVTAGYALTQKTDLQAQYFLYYANNYADNSAASVPYNASAEEHGITGTLIHRFTEAMQWTFKYGWTSFVDKTYGGRNDYEAHMLYSSFRYRF